MSIKSTIFIGVDLSDPFARHTRPSTRATIDINMSCIFDEWKYNPTGNEIIPDEIQPIRFVLAIDGPQGLAKSSECTMRLSEHELGAAGKSPYVFRPIGQPYAGFVRGSVNLFYALHKSQRFQLHGLESKNTNANLIEVYPGAAWPVIAGHKLHKKRLLAGRQSRYELLMRAGIKFSPNYTIELPPTHDQLDAAIAAYTAYLFSIGKTTRHGQNPFEDEKVGVLREGFIIQPVSI